MTFPDPLVPAPGQESVWDYPRPPRAEPTPRRIRIVLAGETLVETTRALRVLETSHPPVYYVPREAIRAGALQPNGRRSVCEFKGVASYWDVVAGDRREAAAAWSYEAPMPGYEAIAHHVAFYPSRMDACFVDDEAIVPQAGDFYGGWVTSDVVGPFKGPPGTLGW